MRDYERSWVHSMVPMLGFFFPGSRVLAPSLEPTCSDFRKALASKLEPSWDQMPPKPNPRTNQKNYVFCKASGSILGGFGVPTWESKGGPKVVVCWLCWLLGPRRPQEAPRGPETASKTDFGTIWIDFCATFGGVLVDF